MTTQPTSLTQSLRLITLLTILTIIIGCADRPGAQTQPIAPTTTSSPPSHFTTPSPHLTPPTSTPEHTPGNTPTTPMFPNAEHSPHPRLFFHAPDIPTLQKRAQTTHANIWKPIEAFVQNQEYIDVRTQHNQTNFEDFRNAGNQLIALAFVCVINQDIQSCDLAKQTMLIYANWQHWDEGETRDLGLAHMLIGNAIAYDWLYPILSQQERQTIRNSLARHATEMYQASIHTTYKPEWLNWWTSAFAQNHNWTNHSSLGIVGLALLDEHQDARLWLDHATERIERVQYLLNGIHDGTWHEGISYQRYGLTSLLAFLINMRTLQGIDLFPHTYLQNYAQWMVYNHLPGTPTYIMAFGDFEWEWINPALSLRVLRFVAAEYHNGYAEWLAQELEHTEGQERDISIWQVPWFVYEFLSYDPTIQPTPPDTLPLARVFDDLSGVIWRTGWSQNDIVFALKTGVYAGHFSIQTFSTQVYPWEQPCAGVACVLNIGHDHLDTNTFYLHANQSWLAPEAVGVDQSATSYHNTILIDNQGQFAPPEEHDDEVPEDFIDNEGYIEQTTNTANIDYIAADATNRYKHIPDINDITRYVIFVRPHYFLMVDSIAADKPHQYDWIMHASDTITVENRLIRADAGNGNLLTVQILAPESFTTTFGTDDLPYVHVRPSENVNNIRLIHLLYPTTTHASQNIPSSSVLEDTGHALAITIPQTSQNSVQYDNILLTYNAQPAEMISVSSYKYDGAAAIISRHHNGSLARIFITGGTTLFDTHIDRDILHLPQLGTFEATYDGEKLIVSGNISTGVTIYAPNIQSVEVNGKQQQFERNGDTITF